jgi:DNA polymerase III sliding clamp (beta) subunit (PCNA family)
LEVSIADLRLALQRTIFAAAEDDARPVFTGVLLELEGDNLVLAAADSFRLAVAHLPYIIAPDGFKALLPAEALKILVALTARAQGTITFETSRTHVPAGKQMVKNIVTGIMEEKLVAAHDDDGRATRISFNGRVLKTVNIHGMFPNWRSLVDSAKTTYHLEMKCADLATAIRRVEHVAKDSSNIVKINVATQADAATLQLSAASDGDEVETLFQSAYAANDGGEEPGSEPESARHYRELRLRVGLPDPLHWQDA